jgi:hypothetical protein
MSSCDAFTLPVTYQFSIACSQVARIIKVQILVTERPADFHLIFLHFSELQDSTHGDSLGIRRIRLFCDSGRGLLFI